MNNCKFYYDVPHYYYETEQQRVKLLPKLIYIYRQLNTENQIMMLMSSTLAENQLLSAVLIINVDLTLFFVSLRLYKLF